MMMFFTPCEELKGSSLFMKLSANYNLIQPYVEKIDETFIDYLNRNIRNIHYYLHFSDTGQPAVTSSGEDAKISSNMVHMFQDDIAG